MHSLSPNVYLSAYLKRPLAKPTCFGRHQMPVLVGRGPQVNKFEQVSNDGYQTLDVTSEARNRGGDRGALCLMLRGGGCTESSNASWVMITWGPL